MSSSGPPSPFVAIVLLIVAITMLGVLYYFVNLLNGAAYIMGKALNVNPNQVNMFGSGVSTILPYVLYSGIGLLLVALVLAILRAIRGE